MKDPTTEELLELIQKSGPVDQEEGEQIIRDLEAIIQAIRQRLSEDKS